MIDRYENMASGLTAPASGAFPVTPHDNEALAVIPRALYVGVGGALDVEMKGGGTVSFKNVPDGALLPVRVVKVLTSSTVASIIGLY